jgi:uncharacterized membrane protein
MNRFIDFNRIDGWLWLIILGIGSIMVSWFALFTMQPPGSFIMRFGITVLIMFLPGYFITKMFFDHLRLSDYPIIDKLLLSVFLSAATVQPLYSLVSYSRNYGFGVDDDIIGSDTIWIVLSLFVIIASFGIKFVRAGYRALR